MIGETMKYAAPVARGYGETMEETAALTGLMARPARLVLPYALVFCVWQGHLKKHLRLWMSLAFLFLMPQKNNRKHRML